MDRPNKQKILELILPEIDDLKDLSRISLTSKTFNSTIEAIKLKLKVAKLINFRYLRCDFLNQYKQLRSLTFETALDTRLRGDQTIELDNLKYLTIYLKKRFHNKLTITLKTPKLKSIECFDLKYIILDEVKTKNVQHLKLCTLGNLFECDVDSFNNLNNLKNLKIIETKELNNLKNYLLTTFPKLEQFIIERDKDPHLRYYSDELGKELKSIIESILEDKKKLEDQRINLGKERKKFRFIFQNKNLKDAKMLKDVDNIKEIARLSDLEFKIRFFNYDHKLRSIDCLNFNEFNRIKKVPINFFIKFTNIKKIIIKKMDAPDIFLYFMNSLNIDPYFGIHLQIEDLDNYQFYSNTLIKINNLKQLNIYSNSVLKIDYKFLFNLKELNRFETNQPIDLLIISRLLKEQTSLDGIRFKYYNQNLVIRKRDDLYLFYDYKFNVNLLYSTELFNKNNERYQNELNKNGYHLKYEELIKKLYQIRESEKRIISLD